MTVNDLENCPGCCVPPGGVHVGNGLCDWEHCPECGQQRIMCDDHAGSQRPAIWHGIAPQREVARKLNWWTTATGIDHLVEDYTRVVFAEHLGQITWDPRAQRYIIGRIDEAAIDEAGRRARPPYIR